MAVVVALWLIAASCGGDDGDSDTSAADGDTTTEESVAEDATTESTAGEAEADAEAEETDAPAAAGEELTIWADETRAPVFEDIGADFTAETGIPVNVVEIGFGDILSNTVQQAPAGEAGDIIVVAHDWLGELVQSGVVAPIDLPNASEYEEVALDAMTVEGQLYGVPISVESLGLFRNTELVPDQVTDWNELVTLGEGLLADGSVDVAVAVQNSPDPDVFHNYPLQTMYGSYIFGTDDEGTYDPSDLGIATDAGFEYAAAWEQWNETGIIDATLDPDTAKQAFTEGRAAFYITGPWFLGDVRDSGVPYAIDPFPSLDGTQGAPFVGVQGIVVNSFSENLLVAQAFTTDFMATQEAQAQLFELSGRAPAHSAATVDAAASDPDIQGLADAASAGQPLPAIPEMAAVWGNFANGYKLILSGVDPAEAFQESEDLIVEAIDG